MLTKRTNILFDHAFWTQLTVLAKERGISVAELIRLALRKTYFEDNEHQEISRACQSIRLNRKSFGKLDYKDLINDGRKH